MHKVYLSLGANIGNRKRMMHDAIVLLEERVGTVLRSSSLLETEPWGFSSPNKFINMCVCIDTPLSPRQLLRVTQQIERDLGRMEKTDGDNYTDRIIDIDILLYDQLHVDESDLKIPHPLMEQREFVMIPLREILED
ncbi:2-amino-4-hydroxy-6-hydroxymethyldihydropteridine diphosphokinase [Prevotella sp. DNF00663]|uniref:2-amino-4-hydroxy-6- hydroxymethyldihydropteridine diphosphokinase n=1 Tax=unclassified Prevotella TaxID=2638335 RepID=UPI000512AAF8|nr:MULTISPECIES: 2-amino-4-hydroxy-6-hydroxymethyldihydropteridine diphosphokinase [unclassified Prevotella]KGI59697.1 2-amino-4-hydroxy-6-hydroxymethyldihydropteridine pyrophosphokinase [Prevotella sp. S7 MS 2]KXB81344.1 2-amino-4-hydroxy-6-hydroxymethyldihydropteridine diphosphokinase [Prevotella sp. DNF00663]